MHLAPGQSALNAGAAHPMRANVHKSHQQTASLLQRHNSCYFVLLGTLPNRSSLALLPLPKAVQCLQVGLNPSPKP